MAALKLIVIALLATFAVQGVAAGDSFKTSINNLSNFVNNAITVLTKALGEAVDKISDAANKTIGAVKGHVNGLFSQIEALQKEAAAQGKNISKCVAPNKAIIAETRENAYAAAKACGQAGVEAAKAAMQNGKARMPDLKPIIDELIKERNACTANNLNCYSKVSAKASLATQTAQHIGDAITLIAQQFGSIVLQAGNCAASILPDVNRNTTTIMKKVVKCANSMG